MGVIQIAGRFEPGTVVELYETTSERQLRPAATSQSVGRVTATTDGDVVFEPATDDVKHIARGFDQDGKLVEIRCMTSNHPQVIQRPVKRSPYRLGVHDALPPERLTAQAPGVSASEQVDPSRSAQPDPSSAPSNDKE